MAEAEAAQPEPQAAIGPLRALLHLLLIAIGWVGFVWLWLIVAQRPWDSQRLLWLIVGSAIVAPILTLIWVLHNRALYRRKGERRAVTSVASPGYPRDWAGRTVSADWPALASSTQVSIRVDDDGSKHYRAESAQRPGSHEAAAR